MIEFRTATPAAGSLDVAWNHERRGEPVIQTHFYNEHTVILRQSKRVECEAPFIYLLFGNERALLLDTGASADPAVFPLRDTVDSLVDAWLREHPRDGYELVVAHTHGHGDHVAADPQFADRPATTVVPHDPDAVRSFFGLTGALAESVVFDLGGRVLEILNSPGHHAAAITIHDPWTGILFTGDTVYPGRLYIADYPAFRATLDRLVDFAANHTVTHVLGCHIEMTSKPGRDFPLGAQYQPAEHVLQLPAAELTTVRDATEQADGRPGIHRHRDFILFNEPGEKEKRALLRRAKLRRLQEKLLRR
ncbi:MBL fold metallo-hydrolase [Actinoplanes sp. NPDC026619]|uniref:MBL fold metallo-hydrolase n=1 Tax=Actinoplanes sp. NPDC026619 TaxID=3155798 RepID=UPI0033C9CA34